MNLVDIKIGTYVKIITSESIHWGYGDTREEMEEDKFYLVKSFKNTQIGLHNPKVPHHNAYFYINDIESFHTKETNPELFL